MKLIEVNDRKTRREFLDMPMRVYKDNDVWVRPLDSSIEKVFDPGKNVFFQHGDVCRWILKNEQGELIGRVAAFINEKKAFKFDQPTGGMGFFECIDDQAAAFLLFDTCKEWLLKRGMEAMDGPINFGENDNFWGLLVDGFIHPSFGMQFNPPYYQAFYEAYGFGSYFEQVTNHLDLTQPFPERFWKIAKWVKSKPGFTFEHFQLDQAERYARDLKRVYDEAWQFHENFTPIEYKDLLESLEEARPILDEELIWFVYYDGQPVAFLVMFPDVNLILKKMNGKMNLFNKLKFVYLKKRHTMTRTRVTVMGVVPKFQRYGLESGIFWHLNEVMKKKPWITEIELSWVGDFNPKMRALHESVGAKFAKRHITYRKLFKTSQTHQRSIVIPVDTKEQQVKANQKEH